MIEQRGWSFCVTKLCEMCMRVCRRAESQYVGQCLNFAGLGRCNLLVQTGFAGEHRRVLEHKIQKAIRIHSKGALILECVNVCVCGSICLYDCFALCELYVSGPWCYYCSLH